MTAAGRTWALAVVTVPDTQMRWSRSQLSSQRTAGFLAARLCDLGLAGWSDRQFVVSRKSKKRWLRGAERAGIKIDFLIRNGSVKIDIDPNHKKRNENEAKIRIHIQKTQISLSKKITCSCELKLVYVKPTYPNSKMTNREKEFFLLTKGTKAATVVSR